MRVLSLGIEDGQGPTPGTARGRHTREPRPPRKRNEQGREQETTLRAGDGDVAWERPGAVERVHVSSWILAGDAATLRMLPRLRCPVQVWRCGCGWAVARWQNARAVSTHGSHLPCLPARQETAVPPAAQPPTPWRRLSAPPSQFHAMDSVLLPVLVPVPGPVPVSVSIPNPVRIATALPVALSASPVRLALRTRFAADLVLIGCDSDGRDATCSRRPCSHP